MEAVGTETSRPSSAAQCVASVAVAELAVNQWEQCIPLLVNKVVADTATERSRIPALEAIGKFAHQILTSQSINRSDLFAVKATYVRTSHRACWRANQIRF